jgi:predicted acyl esterase
VNLCESIVNARFRGGQSAPLMPRDPYAYDITLGNITHVFRRGHSLRLDVTSSSFPAWEPNPNTGHPLGIDSVSNLIVASQYVLHDAQHPSVLQLPVLPHAV